MRKKYLVSFNYDVLVEADNEEEAKSHACKLYNDNALNFNVIKVNIQNNSYADNVVNIYTQVADEKDLHIDGDSCPCHPALEIDTTSNKIIAIHHDKMDRFDNDIPKEYNGKRTCPSDELEILRFAALDSAEDKYLDDIAAAEREADKEEGVSDGNITNAIASEDISKGKSDDEQVSKEKQKKKIINKKGPIILELFKKEDYEKR